MSHHERYDVVAVDLNTKLVRLLATNKTINNAETIRDMAVMRRGVEAEFFSEVQSGMYKDGDVWKGGRHP